MLHFIFTHHPISTGKLSLEELELLQGREGQELRILDTVAADWDQVAIQIGFKPSQVRILERDHANDSRRACWKVFSEWLYRGQDLLPPTWNSLYDVLVNVDYEYAAHQMRGIVLNSQHDTYSKTQPYHNNECH